MSGGVKKLAQVVVGAVIGFVQGNVVGAVIGAGLAFYAAEQQEKLNTKSPLRDNEPSAQTVRSSKAPVRFILGRVATGGVLVWAQEQSGTQTEGEWLHLVYVLCEGSVDALEEIYLGEEPISSFGALASYELVVNPTQVNAFLKANCPDWKDSQIGRGLSYVRLSLQYSAEKFPSGIPDARFVVRGRNDVYDPRNGLSNYSANTALHLLWYLRNRCNVPDDEIVFSTFASAANVCDEAITNADGSVSQRYRTSCVIGADEQKSGVLQKMEAACAGKLIRVGGRWMLQVGAYYGPHDFEITEDMVIGTIGGSTEPSNDAAINTVRGTFIDPTQSWTETDYPEVSIADWVAQDGGEAAETLTFSYVTDPYLAQRLANIELRRRRAGGVITIPMNFAGYNCRPGRVVRVNLPSLNILGEFIVTNWSMGDEEGCNVQLQQYEAAIFDDAVGEPYNPLGFINLPSGGLGAPTGLSWTPNTSAEVVQGVLSWSPPSGIVSEYAVIVRQGANAVQSHTIQAASNRCPISGLASGSYTMSVASIGPMARSGESTINVSVNGPPIPEFCVVQSALESITLIPSNPDQGLNGGTYEFFFTTNPSAPSADAEYLGQGLSFTHTGLAFFTNYYYYVRSSNAYGKSAFLFVPAATSNDVTAYLQGLAGKISESELGKDLVDRLDLIDGPPTLDGSVNERLKEINDQLQEQIDTVAELANSMPYNPDEAYTIGQAALGDDGKLYQAKQAVPKNTPPPNTTYWTDIGEAVRTANGLAARVITVENKVTEQDGKLTAQAERIDGVQTSLNGKANASTVDSIGNRVTQTEQGLTSQGSAITGLTNQVNNIGGDNLLPNSSFEEVGSAGRAKYWLANGGTGSLVDSSLAQSKKAQRVYRVGAALNELAEVTYTPTDGLPYIKVREGASYVLSAYARGTNGKGFAQYLQFINASGGVISTAVNQGIAITDTFKRYTLIASAPAGAVAARPYVGRVVNNSATVSDIWIEVDNVQLQEGAVATAYTASTEQSIATQAAATQALSTRVEQTEQGLSSQSVAITELKNGIGNLGAAGMDAAPAGQWQFDTGVEGWGATNATISQAAGSITVTATTGDPNIFSPIISVNGSLFSRIKAKITRRAGAPTDWEGRVYYSTTAHPVSGSYYASAANPNLAVGESAIIEWDMANLQLGGNDWITSTITRIRLDLGAVIGGAFEVDWIVVGRLGPSASSTVVQQMSSTVSQQGTELTAQAQRLDGLFVQVNPEMEGDSSGMAGQQGSLVGVWTEQSARVEDGIAEGKRNDMLQAQIGENSASVQQLSEVMVDINGKVSAQTTIKAQTTVDGRTVMAGLALGSDGETSEILAFAQRFAIVDQVSGELIVPFVVQNGQVFISQALIGNGWITNAMIGNYIQSNNYVAGLQGWRLWFNGTFEINSPFGGGGRQLINNAGGKIFDQNNQKRYQWGDLSV